MAKEFQNLVELYLHSCTSYSHKPALATKNGNEWEWTTFGQLHTMIDNARGGLHNMGVKPNDMVAVISNNRLEWAVCCYATYGLKAAYVPMYEKQLVSDW